MDRSDNKTYWIDKRNNKQFNIYKNNDLLGEVIMYVSDMITAEIIVQELNKAHDKAYELGYLDGFTDGKTDWF